MGSFNPFSKPKVAPAPPPPPPPVVPSAENSAEDIALAQAEEKERRKQQRGRAATVLSGPRGITARGDDANAGGIATKTLLGG